MKTPIISVIIPCLNEATTIKKLLGQLQAQAQPELEVIAVDNKSTDDTLAYLKLFPVKLVADVPRGVSRARNAGARQARGAWLLFLDADTRLPAGFVTDLLEELAHRPELEAATFSYLADSKNIFYLVFFYLSRCYQQICTALGKPHFTGTGLLVSRSLHQTIGGFNEQLRYAEDLEYSRRLWRRRIVYRRLKLRTYTSVRRLRRGGWFKMLAFYFRFVWARLRGQPFKSAAYNFDDHRQD